MKKIVLLCASGMSTSMLMKKMKDAAVEEGFDCVIEAHAVSLAQETCKDADMVLLGPQVGYSLKTVKDKVTCPVEVIDMIAYGMVDGKSVIKHVREVIGA